MKIAELMLDCLMSGRFEDFDKGVLEDHLQGIDIEKICESRGVAYNVAHKIAREKLCEEVKRVFRPVFDHLEEGE
jgi:hypothetical protein